MEVAVENFCYDLLPEEDLCFCQLSAVIANSTGLHKCVVKLSFFFLVIQTLVSVLAFLDNC